MKYSFKPIQQPNKYMNNITKEGKIPEHWQKGLIKSLYKGKGTKAKCTSERGKQATLGNYTKEKSITGYKKR